MDETKRNKEQTEDTAVDSTTEPSAAADTTTETPAAPQTDTSATSQTAAPAAPTTEANSGSKVQNYVIAVVIIAAMFAGLLYVLQQEGRLGTGTDNTGSLSDMNMNMENVDPDGVAARVNGVTISNQAVLDNMDTLTGQASSQGVDTTSAGFQSEVQTEAVEMLINTQLLIQAAEAEGIEVPESDIDARIEQIAAQIGGEEMLAGRLEEVGMSIEDLRADVEDELTISALIAEKVNVDDISVTDADVEALYNEFGGAEAGLPPLEEVRPQIEAEILANEQQTLVVAYIDTLREDAEIEIVGSDS